MDLSTKISYLGTHMGELVVVGDTWFYSMEDRMDQYQASFTYQFEISSRGLSILRIAWINIKLASPHSLSISSRGLSILKISWISIRLASPHSLSISNSGLSVLRIAWRVSMRRWWLTYALCFHPHLLNLDFLETLFVHCLCYQKWEIL